MSLQDKIVDVAESMGKVYMAGVVRGASNDEDRLPTFDLEIEDKNGNIEKYKVFGYKVEE
jgi:hypothetical protein